MYHSATNVVDITDKECPLITPETFFQDQLKIEMVIVGKFGIVGQHVTQGRPFDPNHAEYRHSDTDTPEQKEMKIKFKEVAHKETEEWQKHKGQAFTMLLKILNPNSLNRVKTHADFKKAELDMDPVALYTIIKKSHEVVGVERGREINKELKIKNDMRQGPNEGVETYATRFSKHCEKLDRLCPDRQKGFDGLDFMNGLDKDRNMLFFGKIWDKVEQEKMMLPTFEMVRSLAMKEEKVYSNEKPLGDGQAQKAVVALVKAVGPPFRPGKKRFHGKGYPMPNKLAKPWENPSVKRGFNDGAAAVNDGGGGYHNKRHRGTDQHGESGGARNQLLCVNCKRNGKPPLVYGSHVFKDCRDLKGGTRKHGVFMTLVGNRGALKTDDVEPMDPKITVLDGAAKKSVFNKYASVELMDAPEPWHVTSITGETIVVDTIGYHTEFGIGMYIPEAPCTCLSQSELCQRFDIRFGGDLGNKYLLKGKNGGGSYVAPLVDGLYRVMPIEGEACDVEFKPNSTTILLADSPILIPPPAPVLPKVEPRILKVVKLHKTLHHCSEDSLIKAIEGGNFSELGITKKDVVDARLGQCRGCLTGKLTKRGTKPVGVKSALEPQIGAKQHCDILFVGALKSAKEMFFLSVDEATNFGMLVHLEDKTTKSIAHAMRLVIGMYKSHGKMTFEFHADREETIHSVTDTLLVLGVRVVQTGAGVHEKVAERYTRVIRERFRATIADLRELYELPEQFYTDLVRDVVYGLNHTPNSKTGKLTPYSLVSDQDFVDGHYLKHSFGELGYTHNSNASNANEPRGQLAMVLGHEPESAAMKLYLLGESHRRKPVVSRSTFVPIDPKPEELILIGRVRGEIPPVPDVELQHVVVSSTENQSSDQMAEPASQVVAFDGPVDRGGEPVTMNTLGNPPTTTSVVENILASVEDEEDEVLPALIPIPLSWDPIKHSPSVMVRPPKNGEAFLDMLPWMNKTGDEIAAEGVIAPDAEKYQTRSGRATKSVDYSHLNSKGTGMAPANFVGIVLDNSQDGDDPRVQASIKAELKQMIDYNVWSPVQSKHSGAQLIPSKIFTVEKLDAQGKYIKHKSRLVAGGHREYVPLGTDTSSPTVRTESLFLCVSIAVTLNLDIWTVDVGGAFLEAALERPDVYVSLQPNVASLLVEMYPKYKDFLQNDGKIIVHLKKAMYGLKESSMEFHRLLRETLIKIGFTQCKNDAALFYKGRGFDLQIVSTHVDDLGCFGTSKNNEWLTEQLKRCFKSISIERNTKTFQYLGIAGKKLNDGSIVLNQPGFVEKIIKSFELETNKVTDMPYGGDLFQANGELEVHEEAVFRSRLMQISFLTRTRPDIKLPIAYLSTRMHKPTIQDHLKLNRVARYLNGTRTLGLVFRSCNMKLFCSADASYSIHDDRHGHSGSVLWLGNMNAPIHVSSKKQKLVARSSTEAELVSLSEASEEVLWCRRILEELGFPQEHATVVEQDNMSTMTIAKKGPGRSSRTKAIDTRYYWITEHIEEGNIVLEHMPSNFMLADALTKPVPRPKFLEWRKQILNHNIGEHAL